MVHTTDTRSQKVVRYTSAHITETVFAHDQLWEEQSALSSPQLYRHSQENGYPWHTVALEHHTTGVSTCPTLRGAKHFPSTSYFFMLGVYTVSTYFYHTKAILMRRKHWNNSRTTTAFGLHHTGALNNWGKMKICKKASDIISDRIKKLNEDVHRINNWKPTSYFSARHQRSCHNG